MTNLRLSHAKKTESVDETNEEAQATNDDTDQTETYESHNNQQEHTEQTEEIEEPEAKPEETPAPQVPSEFAVRLQHKKSMEEQIIETKQDNDLTEEMQKNKEEGEHQPGEDLSKVEEEKPKESV